MTESLPQAVLEAADIIPLPAVERNRHAAERRQCMIGIDAQPAIALLGESIGLFDLGVVGHGRIIVAKSDAHKP